MNARIEQLAMEAGMSRDKFGLYFDTRDPDDGVDLEKFAQLLISAVMAEVEDEVQYQCGRANAVIVENRVKKEFGVKE
jgi:hypothetical protein